jgi:hypothetical protein
MAVKNCCVEDTVLPLLRRERYRTLCHRWLPMEGGDGTSMAHCMASLLVNIAHIPKINDLRGTAALPIKRPVSNGEMTGSGEDSDAAQDPQRHRSSYAPVQTIACEVTAHEQTPNPAR